MTKETEPVDDLTAHPDGASPASIPPPTSQDTAPRHTPTSTALIRYLPVVRKGALLGFLWATETDDAVGFLALDTAEEPAARFWADRIAHSEREGLRPLQILRRWGGTAEDPVGGTVPAAARERIAVSLDVLRALPSLQ